MLLSLLFLDVFFYFSRQEYVFTVWVKLAFTAFEKWRLNIFGNVDNESESFSIHFPIRLASGKLLCTNQAFTGYNFQVFSCNVDTGVTF